MFLSAVIAPPAQARPFAANDNYLRATLGAQTIALDWAGNQVASPGGDTIVGERVLIPGDRILRTIDVVNAGPTDAVLSAALTLIPGGRRDSAGEEDFAQAVQFFWALAAGGSSGGNSAGIANITGTAPVGELLADSGVFLSNVLAPRGKVNQLTVGIELPDSINDHFAGALPNFALTISLTDPTPEPPSILPPPGNPPSNPPNNPPNNPPSNPPNGGGPNVGNGWPGPGQGSDFDTGGGYQPGNQSNGPGTGNPSDSSDVGASGAGGPSVGTTGGGAGSGQGSSGDGNGDSHGSGASVAGGPSLAATGAELTSWVLIIGGLISLWVAAFLIRKPRKQSTERT
ncbi:MAG: hypothetical protein LBB58_06935 [Cellulomonadaceae bacterium]|nr:hypothetical protein [Cellulomonadaceae bacterium]